MDEMGSEMDDIVESFSRNDSGGSVPWNKYSDHSVFYDKNTMPRAVGGLTCVLSMTGAVLIILSYFISKKLRSQTRLILLHLSLMDFGVALANFIGIAVNFNPYYIHALETGQTVSAAIKYSCISDAILACFCTNSSVLWTLAVAVFLHFRIVTDSSRSERFYRILLYLMIVINYGLPLLITLWMLLTHRLGFAPYDGSGWCSIIVIKSKFMSPKEGIRNIDKYAAFFASDMLIMLTVILIPFLYCSIRSHAKKQLTSVMTENKSNLKNKLQSLDLKFTAIPVFFIFLRIWSLIMSIIYDYVGVSDDHIPQQISLILLYLSAIGDSGQGAANGIIFVIFTKKARQILTRVFCCLKCCKTRLQTLENNSNNDDDDDNNQTEANTITGSSLDEENKPFLTNSSSHQRYQAGGQTLYIIQSH